jgi:hypothetical protein
MWRYAARNAAVTKSEGPRLLAIHEIVDPQSGGALQIALAVGASPTSQKAHTFHD